MQVENINLTEDYKAEIKAYLSDTDSTFADGFQLMQKYSIKVSLMHMMARKATQPLMRKKMDYELTKIAGRDIIKLSPYFDKAVTQKQHPTIGKATAQQKNEKTATENAIIDQLSEANHGQVMVLLRNRVKIVLKEKEFDYTALPPAIKLAYENARRFYHLYRHYHTQMKIVETDDERANCLKLAKEYEDLNKAEWYTVDEYLKSEIVPPPTETPKVDTAANAARALGTAKSYLCRYADDLDTLEGKKYEYRKGMVQKKADLLIEHDMLPKDLIPLLQKHGIISNE